MNVILCGIIKNEADNIVRTLESFKVVADKVILTDTGSTDGTQALIRDWLTRTGTPGVLYEAPWEPLAESLCIPKRADGSPPLFDYAIARNLAVSLALQHCEDIQSDWIFEIDSTWELKGGVKDLRKGLETAPPALTGFEIMVDQIGMSIVPYLRLRRARECGQGRWAWSFPIHEFLWRTDNAQIGRIEGIWVDHRDTEQSAANRLKRLERDVIILTELIEGYEARGVADRPFSDHERGLLTRAWFYLGQSYEGLGRTADAYGAYVKRAKLKGAVNEWGQAAYRAGRCALALGVPGWALRRYLEAFAVSGRPEGLWEAAALMSPNEGAVCAQLAFEAAKAQKPDAGGFSIPAAYALAHFGPARDDETIKARLRQMQLMGVVSAGNLDRQGEGV